MPNTKKIIIKLLLVIFLFGVGISFLPIRPAQAQMATAATTVADIPRIIGQIGDKIWLFVQRAAKVVYKNALDYFLQRIAYDTASYLATGEKGQKPLFWDQGVGDYLLEIGNEAVGSALDDLAKDAFGVSLCEPFNASIKLKLIVQAKQTFQPQRATCTFNDILKSKLLNVTVNGQKPDLRKLDNEDFKLLANYFDPYSNELGAQYLIGTNISTKQARDKELAMIVRSLEPEMKSLTSLIGGVGFSDIKTPSFVNKETFRESIAGALTGGQRTLTGDIVADAVNTFTNTFASKFLARLKKGFLSGKGGATGGGPGDFLVGSSFATRGADSSFADFIVPTFRGGGKVDVLGKLSACPPENQARLFDNCIIDSNLATAIDQKLTVRQAIEQGYLDSNKPFGFLADGTEPTYTNGYPYRSLVFMRKYRIIPVTWELAALYIRDINTAEKKSYSLAEVMGTENNNYLAFSSDTSPFYHLVDPNWVLKLPEYECRVEGPGPQITQRINVQIETGDGLGGTVKVNEEFLERANYCADELTCILENANGTCQKYGYCTSERNTWNFQGQDCSPQFSTCESFVKKTDNAKVSYLVSTLQSCDSSQVGCRWYSMYKTANGTWAEDIWNAATNSAGADGQITFGDVFNRIDLGNISYARHFNNQVKTCSARDEGCNKYIELSSLTAPEGYEATTQSIFQYVQDNQVQYAESGLNDSYGEWGLVKEKFLQKPPAHLNCPTDLNSPNRDPECDNYAQSCTATEVGCNLYTPLDGDPPVPAVLTANDYCSAACVGYEQYLEVPTYFEKRANPTISGTIKNLIPTTATACSLAEIGCEEFTNLDEVAKGGEGREYFSYLRECILPNDPAAKVFYTWEGSDTTGYQLKTWRLQAESGAAPTGDDCDPGDDPLNCRTFIDATGDNWNRDIMTVTYATDDCHPFRRTVDSSVIYGIESFSRSCRAQAVGCKEYRGNQGNVVTILVNDDFESGTSEGWINGFNSSESVYVGGHSLRTQGAPTYKDVKSLIEQGKNYTISFWARSQAASATLSFEIQQWEVSQITRADKDKFAFINKAKAQAIVNFEDLQPIGGTQRSFGSVDLTDEWQYYRLGPLTFDRALGTYEFLQTNGGNFYIDNIILREVTDNYYLIADSWETPAVCNQPYNGAQLGCRAYRDATNSQINLLGFTSICSEAKVGCKALIDTKNSNSPFSQTYNTGNNSFSDPFGLDDIEVPSDSLVYLVDDQDKYCNAALAGCRLAGEAVMDRQSNGAVVGFNEKFIIDNPENYNISLCGNNGLYCEQYTNERTGANAFYIDPGQRTCEYKLLPGRTRADWYRTGTEELCTPFQTFPYQPVPATSANYNGWVGICNEASGGCSQYIDPEADGATSTRSYFYLEQSVNTASCNGLVDRERGCRLFNKTDGTPQAFTVSAYSAAETPNGSVPISSTNPAQNNANIILQVQKDRVCSQWLYCKTRIEAYDSEGNRDDKCFDIGLCDRLDSSGECINFPSVPNNTEILGQQISGTTSPSVENLRLMSGYTKAGMIWSGFSSGDGTIPGYLPYHFMTQVGNEANLLYNPSFEDTVATNEPLQSPFPFWNTNGSDCDSNSTCRVKPDTRSISGVKTAYLTISANNSSAGPSHFYIQQDLALSPAEYILSGFIKWENIPDHPNTTGANIRINQGVNTLGEFGPREQYSNGWEQFSIKFTNTANNVTIRAELFDTREGSLFIDGLSILPALQVTNNPEKLLSQRCRLYPENNSPECNYIKGTKSYVGWPGFCVEPDPRNPSYCVNWWPIDIIKGSVGQINEQQLIFEEKVPLYYCLLSEGNESSNPGYMSYNHDNYIYNMNRGDRDYNTWYIDGNCNNDRGAYSNGFTVGGCTRGSGGQATYRTAVGVEVQSIREYEIEKIVLTEVGLNTSPGCCGPGEWPQEIVLTRENRMTKAELVANWGSADIANNMDDDDVVYWTRCGWNPTNGYPGDPNDAPVDGSCSYGVNYFRFAIIFEGNNTIYNGAPKVYFWHMDDYSGDESEAGLYQVKFYLREACSVLAKVAQVEPNGSITSYPYWTRLDEFSGYITTSTGYYYSKDSEPFGAVYQSGLSNYFQNGSNLLQDENTPSTWDSRPTEPGNQPIYVEAENTLTINSGSLNPGPNIRAGQPYGCYGGGCVGSICVGGPNEGNLCNSDESAQSCFGGDGVSFGVCVGSWQTPNPMPNTDTLSARNSLSQLFIKSLGEYRWQFDNDVWRYIAVAGGGWNNAATGVLPQIGNVKVDDQDDIVNLVNGGTIKLTFTTNITNDQLPLRSYSINWGDGSSNTTVQGYYNERPSPGDPHVLYHSYNSSAVGNRNITIQVMDNWGFGAQPQRYAEFIKTDAVCIGSGCGGGIVPF